MAELVPEGLVARMVEVPEAPTTVAGAVVVAAADTSVEAVGLPRATRAAMVAAAGAGPILSAAQIP